MLTGRGFRVLRREKGTSGVVANLPCAREEPSYQEQQKAEEGAKQVTWCLEQVLASLVGGLSGLKGELSSVRGQLEEAEQSFSLD